MSDLMVSALFGPKMSLPWLGMLVLIALGLAYALLELAMVAGLRRLWRWASRQNGGQKKGRPEGRP